MSRHRRQVKGAQSAVSAAYTVLPRQSQRSVCGIGFDAGRAHRVEPRAATIVFTVRRIASDNASILRPPNCALPGVAALTIKERHRLPIPRQ